MAPMRKRTSSTSRKTTTPPGKLTKTSSGLSNMKRRAASLTGLPTRDAFFATCIQELNTFLTLSSTPYATLSPETLAQSCHETRIRAACSLRDVKHTTFSKPGCFITPEGTKGVACHICPERPTQDLQIALKGPRKTFSTSNSKAWRRHLHSNVHMDMMSLLLRVKRECLLDALKCPMCSHTCAGQRSDALKRHVRLHHPGASWESTRAFFSADDEPEDTEIERESEIHVASASSQISLPSTASPLSPFSLTPASSVNLTEASDASFAPILNALDLSLPSQSLVPELSSISSTESSFFEAALLPWFDSNFQSALGDAPFSMQELEQYGLAANRTSYTCISQQLSQEMQSVLRNSSPDRALAHGDTDIHYTAPTLLYADNELAQLDIVDSFSWIDIFL